MWQNIDEMHYLCPSAVFIYSTSQTATVYYKTTANVVFNKNAHYRSDDDNDDYDYDEDDVVITNDPFADEAIES